MDRYGLICEPEGSCGRRWCFCGRGGKFAAFPLGSTLWNSSLTSLTSERQSPGEGEAASVRCRLRTYIAMTNAALKKNHWTSRVNECSVGKDTRGDLNVSLRGGAENGEFAYIGQVNENLVFYRDGKLNEGELLLEVENLSISGLPLYDVQNLIKNCKSPVKLKTVRPGKSLKVVWGGNKSACGLARFRLLCMLEETVWNNLFLNSP